MAAHAAAEPRYDVAAAAGVVSADDATPITTLTASVHLPYQISAGVELAGYTTTMAMPDDSRGHVIVVPVLARVAYRQPWRRGDLYAGGAAGAAFSSVMFAGMAERAVIPAAGGFAGVSARVGPAHVVFETLYVHATRAGDKLGGTSATLGITYPF